MMNEALRSVRMAFFGSDREVFRSIERDHQNILTLIEQSENNQSFDEKKSAFNSLFPLLVENSLSEDEIYQKFIQIARERECDEETCVSLKECIEEHRWQREMIRTIQITESEMRWNTRTRMLLESIVEHVQEEEQEVYPFFKALFDMEEREILGEKYLELKQALNLSQNRKVLSEISEIEKNKTTSMSLVSALKVAKLRPEARVGVSV